MGKRVLGLVLFVVALFVSYFVARLIAHSFIQFIPENLTESELATWSTMLGGLQVLIWFGLMFLSARFVRRHLYSETK